jgi:phosphoserine/homoserine phosphotransferase
MRLICLDLEGVLIPEIWIAFAEATGVPELRRTTRDEPDYEKLMAYRLEILRARGFRLPDIQQVIATIDPLEGATAFIEALRLRVPFVILSDTFEEFTRPLLPKLGYPLLFCNSLVTGADGTVTGFRLRQSDGKRRAVAAFRGLNSAVFAAGDSYNDLSMIREAGSGCLFRPPEAIRKSAGIESTDTYDELLARIDQFLASAG